MKAADLVVSFGGLEGGRIIGGALSDDML